MTDITYDAGADAVYISVGDSKIDRTEEAGPFIYDVDAEGHIVGIEIPSASKVLAPGDWRETERLRAQGLRPVQHWVPDLRDPKVLAELRREVELMARHPENDVIDAWNEEAYDWSAWK
jgi:uncharacterized protein YuzE